MIEFMDLLTSICIILLSISAIGDEKRLEQLEQSRVNLIKVLENHNEIFKFLLNKK